MSAAPALRVRDEDCILDSDEQCVACGVSHTYRCHECGGRGFHRGGCSELDEPDYYERAELARELEDER